MPTTNSLAPYQHSTQYLPAWTSPKFSLRQLGWPLACRLLCNRHFRAGAEEEARRPDGRRTSAPLRRTWELRRDKVTPLLDLMQITLGLHGVHLEISNAEAWKNAQWLQDVIFEISAGAPRPPVTMMGDNQSCLTVLDTGFPNASRHLRLRFHALQEAVKAGDMVLVHVSSEEQLADGLTKALGGIKHEAFLQSLGMKG